MSHPQDKDELGQLQYETEHTAIPAKGHSVVLYLAILFAVAFLLLLLAYFMQQRTNETAIQNLQDSVTSFRSIDELIEDNQSLRDQVDALRDQRDSLEDRLRMADTQVTQLEAELAATQRLLEAASPSPDP